MPEKKYQINDVIGDYTIVGYKKEKGKRLKYLLKCKICGTIKEKSSYELTSNRGITHNSCNRHLRTFDKRFWEIYAKAKHRCSNKKDKDSKYYYEKGIKFELGTYEDFYQKCYKGYKEHCDKYGIKNTTIDRIDGNKNYSYDNIRWATIKEQNLNKDLKKIGAKIGKQQQKISDENILKYYKLYKENKITVREIANQFNVKTITIYKRFQKINK